MIIIYFSTLPGAVIIGLRRVKLSSLIFPFIRIMVIVSHRLDNNEVPMESNDLNPSRDKGLEVKV